MRLMGILSLAWLLATPTLAQPPAAAAQSPVDEDFAFGLLATYRGGGRSLQRVDPDIAFAWAAAAPDPRLPPGPFTTEWRGQLLLRQRAEHTFAAYVQGRVTVEVNGQTVLDAERDTPGWVAGNPRMLDFGETPLRVRFQKTQPEARLSMFWSSSVFPIEPLPSQLLLHERKTAETAAIIRGRSAFTAYRCNRCHVRKQELPAPRGPDLSGIGLGVRRDWLVSMLRKPRGHSAHARMPDFALTEAEAQAVAAFLTSHTQPRRLPKLNKIQASDGQEGRLLLHGLGCLACHQLGQLGKASAYSGGDLSQIGSKRSAEWLQQWLRDPASLNRDHRMPVFSLTDTERRQLAVALSSLRGSASAPPPSAARSPQAEQIARGRQLVESARCAACHRIPQITVAPMQLPDLANVDAIDWARSCVGQQPNSRVRQPRFPAGIAADIRAYVQSRGGPLSPPSAFDRGRSLLERRNCLACHPRGTGQGFGEWSGRIAASVSGLARQSESMIPPSLTAVGDKLQDAALRTSVMGKQSGQRLPWLRIRMPRFRHSPAEVNDIVTYLIAHDRMPPPAATTPQPTVARDARLLAGHDLVGARGLNCVACHRIGKFQPRNVALGTRGSELLMPGKRLRREYFLRWTRSPLRIVPGMEMPSYLKSVPGVLDGNIDTQLSAIWDALNDPNFTVPTSPSAVEQFLVTRSGDPARIVRDVFTHPSPAPHNYTPRPLAVGLENGHTLVFDMDAFCVRQWLLGDMARQRTQGKSWYWDAAGVALMSDFPLNPDVVVFRDGQDAPLTPLVRQGRRGRLLSYARRGLGISWSYALQFEPSPGKPSNATVPPLEVVVRETLQPVTDGDRSGAERNLSVDLPAGWSAEFARTPAVSVLGQAEITYRADGDWQPLVSEKPPAGQTAGISIPRRSPLRIRYLARLRSTKLDLKPAAQPPRQPLQAVTSVPGFEGTQLPLDGSIMPTAMTWTADGHLAFTSLKGHVYLARDTDGDGLPDKLSLFEEGLAAPFGILADGADLIVAHKPEILRLRDTDGDGRADQRSIIASGWGYTDNYHDWTCGIVRDKRGNIYVGLGSDYGQPKRPRDRARWRGAVLRITPSGTTEPVGFSFRYPVGLAITEDDQIFVSDNQGVQNTFNEINHLQIGRHYGVPNRYETQRDAPATPPALQIPHPWTRSVNGLVFLPTGEQFAAMGGHGIGCEYDSRFLIRFSLQRVGDVYQGAAYYFSDPTAKVKSSNFEGPICAAVSPQGDLYIGSIHDSGWLGGRNTGSIVRLRRREQQPNGIRELRATADGFEIEFLRPVDPGTASRPDSYSVSAYTRNWKGSYSTPDADRHKPLIQSLTLSPDRRTVRLRIPARRTGFVYEVRCGDIGTTEQRRLWPTTGHYTLHAIPPAAPR